MRVKRYILCFLVLWIRISLASRPHPSVSGLVMTVCACVDFTRKPGKNGVANLGIRILSITRAIAKRYSTPSQLVGKAGITFKRRPDTRDTQRTIATPFLPGFLVKSTHAQTVITRPLTEGCGLEARLDSHQRRLKTFLVPLL